MKLPSKVWSQLGAVPVTLAANLRQDDAKPDSLAYGLWDEDQRAISVDPTACTATQIKTLFHEMCHIALNDAGVHNTLSDSGVELVCDVIGSYFGGAFLAGFIKLQVPKE